MPEINQRTRVLECSPGGPLPFQDLVDTQEPVILKGYANNWPLVQAGKRSKEEAMAYLKSFSVEEPLVCYVGQSSIKGRFAYNSDVTSFNFRSERTRVSDFLTRIDSATGEQGDYLYIGSTALDKYFPGLRDHNDINLSDPTLKEHPPLVSIWMGNRTIASAHYDLAHNIACCAVGRRRFTLFPPEQIANLYPGPLDPTPGGQAISMVNFDNPDLSQHPNFNRALEAGQQADLEAGDVLVYPSMWWHQVEALEDFNVLINYWWSTSPKYIDTPMTTLMHALLSLRDRPDHEKQAWRALFDYYVFGDPERPRAHIPEYAQGQLAPLDEISARRLRALTAAKLNR